MFNLEQERGWIRQKIRNIFWVLWFTALLVLGIVFRDIFPNPWLQAFVIVALILGWLYAITTVCVINQNMRKAVAFRRMNEARCYKCGYLRGENPKCTECGTAFIEGTKPSQKPRKKIKKTKEEAVDATP